MASLTNQEATLTAEPTTLFTSHFAGCHLRVTGIAGEFTTIPFQTTTRGLFNSRFFEAAEVRLSASQTIPSGAIRAKAPDGVGSLDIVYNVRSRGDARGG
jgi:hypothetical protein